MQTFSNQAVLFATSYESRIALSYRISSSIIPYWCTSLLQAQSLLHRRHDLIVCCTDFDSSRMFDMLRYCKSNPKICTTPVVCVRIGGNTFDDITSEGIGIACKALGAVGFMDIDRLMVKLGRDLALEETNKIFNELANTGYQQHSYEYRVLH